MKVGDKVVLEGKDTPKAEKGQIRRVEGTTISGKIWLRCLPPMCTGYHEGEGVWEFSADGDFLWTGNCDYRIVPVKNEIPAQGDKMEYYTRRHPIDLEDSKTLLFEGYAIYNIQDTKLKHIKLGYIFRHGNSEIPVLVNLKSGSALRYDASDDNVYKVKITEVDKLDDSIVRVEFK